MSKKEENKKANLQTRNISVNNSLSFKKIGSYYIYTTG